MRVSNPPYSVLIVFIYGSSDSPITIRPAFKLAKYKACLVTPHLHHRWQVAQSHVKQASLHAGKMVQSSFS